MAHKTGLYTIRHLTADRATPHFGLPQRFMLLYGRAKTSYTDGTPLGAKIFLNFLLISIKKS
jgi:hypothetical protein